MLTALNGTMLSAVRRLADTMMTGNATARRLPPPARIDHCGQSVRLEPLCLDQVAELRRVAHGAENAFKYLRYRLVA
jgi:hypothetical protein